MYTVQYSLLRVLNSLSALWKSLLLLYKTYALRPVRAWIPPTQGSTQVSSSLKFIIENNFWKPRSGHSVKVLFPVSLCLSVLSFMVKVFNSTFVWSYKLRTYGFSVTDILLPHYSLLRKIQKNLNSHDFIKFYHRISSCVFRSVLAIVLLVDWYPRQT